MRGSRAAGSIPTTDTYLAEPPWSTESQLRLFLADERFLQFSDVFHRPVVAHGPGLFIDAPLWHLDTAVNPVERRRAKAIAYEFARPGMSISGRCHNQALYVPELVPNVAVAVVPCADHAVIDAVVAGGVAATRKSRASLAYASAGRYRPGLAGAAIRRHAAPGTDRGRGIARLDEGGCAGDDRRLHHERERGNLAVGKGRATRDPTRLPVEPRRQTRSRADRHSGRRSRPISAPAKPVSFPCTSFPPSRRRAI